MCAFTKSDNKYKNKLLFSIYYNPTILQEFYLSKVGAYETKIFGVL